MRRILTIVAGVIAFGSLAAVPASASAHNPPVCEKVTVQENPAFPNPQITYPITLCGDKALPIRSLTVDGAQLPEKTTTHTRVVFWSATAARTDLIHLTAATAPARRCARSISTSGNAYSVVIHIRQSCGRSYRAVLFAGGGTADGYHYGTYTKVNGNYSTACIVPSTCGSGGGTVQWGGYQRKTDGKMFCAYLCAAGHIHTVALVVTPAGGHGSPAAPVPGRSSHLRRTSTFDQQDEWFGDCQRDPSSGGLGTIVVNSSCGTSNAMDWAYQANGTCGGKVTATCPGGPISASQALRGDFIITIRNIGQGSLCEGADAQTNWTMKMFTCDGVGGVHHFNNLFVWSQTASCSGGFSGNDLISYQWNQNGNADTASVYNPGGTGSNVEVAPVPPHCPEALWRLNGS